MKSRRALIIVLGLVLITSVFSALWWSNIINWPCWIDPISPNEFEVVISACDDVLIQGRTDNGLYMVVKAESIGKYVEVPGYYLVRLDTWKWQFLQDTKFVGIINDSILMFDQGELYLIDEMHWITLEELNIDQVADWALLVGNLDIFSNYSGDEVIAIAKDFSTVDHPGYYFTREGGNSAVYSAIRDAELPITTIYSSVDFGIEKAVSHDGKYYLLSQSVYDSQTEEEVVNIEKSFLAFQETGLFWAYDNSVFFSFRDRFSRGHYGLFEYSPSFGIARYMIPDGYWKVESP